MKRGPKAVPPSEHAKRGTLQPSRHGSAKTAWAEIGKISVISPDDLPGKPEWLSSEASMVWDDDLPRVIQAGFVREFDASMFAQYCSVVGACNAAWRAKDVPPAAYLTESRKLAEMFGILGSKSRVKGKSDGGGGTQNPFKSNGTRRP